MPSEIVSAEDSILPLDEFSEIDHSFCFEESNTEQSYGGTFKK